MSVGEPASWARGGGLEWEKGDAWDDLRGDMETGNGGDGGLAAFGMAAATMAEREETGGEGRGLGEEGKMVGGGGDNAAAGGEEGEASARGKTGVLGVLGDVSETSPSEKRRRASPTFRSVWMYAT